MTSPTPTSRPVVELLAWSGCPSHPQALAMLETVLTELGERDSVVVRWVESDVEARAERFVGSPTIRIDGRDVAPVGEDFGLTCRVYQKRDGRFSPVPDPDDLRDALAAAFGSDQNHA